MRYLDEGLQGLPHTLIRHMCNSSLAPVSAVSAVLVVLAGQDQSPWRTPC
jgi:hypothetical protein